MFIIEFSAFAEFIKTSLSTCRNFHSTQSPEELDELLQNAETKRFLVLEHVFNNEAVESKHDA